MTKTIVLRDDTVLFIAPKHAELLDLAAHRWVLVGPTNVDRTHAGMAPLPTGHVLLAGGTGADGKAVRSTELYDPVEHAFFAGADMVNPRSDPSLTVLSDGDVIIAGGAVTTDVERYHAPRRQDCRPSATTVCLQNDRFGISVQAFDERTGQRFDLPVIDRSDTILFFALPGNVGTTLNPDAVVMLNAAGDGVHFGVYYAVFSDLEFTITAEDTRTGEHHIYRKQQFSPVASAIDDAAFPHPGHVRPCCHR